MHFSMVRCAVALALGSAMVMANPRVIRTELPKRIPSLGPIVDVRPTPMAGIFEVAIEGGDILYTDALANYFLHGDLYDARVQRNLTQERQQALTAVAFEKLPLKDAFTVVRGNGKRRLAVFSDPNCGYCKRLEADLLKVDHVTVYVFLYPVLGPDSQKKSRAVWCAKDRAKTWLDWMIRGVALAEGEFAGCDASALTRNMGFGRKYRITGTPALFFENGKRVPGAISKEQIEQELAQASQS